MKENNGVKSTKNPERSNMEECDMCEKDVQNCRVGRDGSLDRNQKEDCSNTVGRESDEHNKETENQAEIKKHTETTEDNSNKIQPPTVDKEHSNISKVDKNIEHSEGKGEELHSHTKTDCNATTTETDGDRKAESYKDYGQEMYTHTNTEFKVTTKAEDGEKISKDYGQESYTHPDTDYKVTTTVTDDDKKEESSKDYHQEFYTHKKTDYKTTTPVTGGAMNTPERDEQVKAALAKARQFKTYDDEDEDTVYDYKKDKGDEQVKAALAKARQFKTYDDEDEDTVYDYKKDKGFIKACKKYVYFWRNKDIYSQWHKSVFTVNDKTFNCAEQYMMYKKAELFQDDKIAKKILSEKSPRKIKHLGRQVENFSEGLWAANCLYIVKQANIAKFSQNDDLKKELFNTHPKVLVEASPYDKVWGIGLAEDDCEAWDERKWRGKNLLGYILTEVRDELMCDAGRIQKHVKQEYLTLLLAQTHEAIENQTNGGK